MSEESDAAQAPVPSEAQAPVPSSGESAVTATDRGPSSSSVEGLGTFAGFDEDLGGKIFVGGLSWTTTEDGLRFYFERFGEVEGVDLMLDKNTGHPRFVCVQNSSCQANALLLTLSSSPLPPPHPPTLPASALLP